MSYLDLQGTNLFLIGMMGAGKSTIGKRLAPQLGYRFVDTDDLISACAGKSIPQIFTEVGEAGFRQLETHVLQEVASYSRLVIATGGGIVLSDRNWSYLHHGIVLWLDVPIEQLWQRLSQSTSPRPLLENPTPLETLKNLIESRHDRYALADVKVNASDEPEVVCTHIFDQLAERIEPNRLKRANQYPDGNTSPQNGHAQSPDTP